jgi:hypothetical protein
MVAWIEKGVKRRKGLVQMNVSDMRKGGVQERLVNQEKGIKKSFFLFPDLSSSKGVCPSMYGWKSQMMYY